MRKVFLLLLAGALCTCESLGSIAQALMKEPVLSLDSVTLTGIDLTGADLLCTVKVENPNTIDIPFPHIDWDFFINANHFVNGAIQNGEKLKAKSATPVPVPLHIDYASLYQTLQSVKGAKSADYKIALDATITMPVLGDLSYPLEFSGTLPLAQLPKLSDAALSIDKVDFSGIDLLCTVKVENPNVFAIPFPQMDFNYSVNKTPLITSTVEHTGPIAAETVQTIPIRLSLVYADLYKTSQSLLSVGEAAGVMALTSAFAIPAFADEDGQSLEVSNKLPLLKPPVITFKGITLKNINLSELVTGISKVDFQMNFEVENKNSFALNLDSLAYKLAVNNASWVEGVAPSKTAVKANQKVTVPLNLSVNALSLVKDIAALVVNHKTNIPYLCEGGANISGALEGLKPITLPFSFTGVTTF